MKDIFDILGVPANASKSMLKESFLKWKKEQQDILRKGKPEEQKIAAEQITEVTALYKDVVNNFVDYDVTKNTDVSFSKDDNNKGDNNISINFNKSVSTLETNYYSAYNKNYNNKPLAGVLLLFFVICLCTGGYFFYYKNNNFASRNISFLGTSLKNTLPDYSDLPELPELPEISENGRESDINSSNQGIKKNNANETKSKVNNKKLTDEDIAKDIFVKYHEALGNHDFNTAYNMMSPICKNNMGDPDKLAVSFKDTIESKVSNLNLVKSEKDELIFDYVLDSKDKMDGNKILYQKFKGQVHMFKIDGEWKVGYSESKRINNYIK